MIENKEEQTLLDSYVIYTKTDLKGIITYASTAFTEICGYSKEELIGQPHNIIRHPDMPALAFEDLWNTIQDGKIWEGTVKNRKKNGDFYITKSIVSPLFDENNNIIGYSSVREDISERIKAEEFQKRLGHLVKETKLKQIGIINEYKEQSLKKDKLLQELERKNNLLESNLLKSESSIEFLQTKLNIQAQRLGAKKEPFKANEIVNT